MGTLQCSASPSGAKQQSTCSLRSHAEERSSQLLSPKDEANDATVAQFWNCGCVCACRDVLAHLGVRHIDFLSLDVEGGEQSVLQTLDFDQVPFGTGAHLLYECCMLTSL